MDMMKNNQYINNSEEFINQLENKKLIYEVIRIIDRIPLFLQDHIKRLNETLKIIKEDSVNEENIKIILKNLTLRNNVKNGNVKIIYDFNNKDIYAFFVPHRYPAEREYKEGVKTILYFGERNNPNAKVMDISFRKKVNAQIEKNNAFEAILVNSDGYITEGSKSNIFLVKENILYTSPDKQVLPGITREKILYLCRKHYIKVLEKNINYKDLDSYDGLFISGTSPKILPVKSTDNINFKSSENKIIIKLLKYYDLLIEKYLKENQL